MNDQPPPNWPFTELEFWGYGLGHMESVRLKPCPRCDGRGRVGPESFPSCCPQCRGERIVTA